MDMKDIRHCVSCGISLAGEGAIKFKCPSCGEWLGRCGKCRQQSNAYVCPKCKYLGP